MPSDIRDFFGGNRPAAAKNAETAAGKTEAPKKRGRPRKVLDDSDEDATKPASKNATPKRSTPKKRNASPAAVETTASDYFAKSKKKKSEAAEYNFTPKQSPAKTTQTPPSQLRSSRRSRGTVNYKEDKEDGDGDVKMLDDDFEAKDDIFHQQYKPNKGGADDYEEDSDGGDLPKGASPDGETKQTRTKGNSSKAGSKRKSDAVVNDAGKGSPAKKQKAAPKPRGNPKEKPAENTEIQAIFDSIPKVKPPTPEPADGNDNKKKGFSAYQHQANAGPPPNAGQVELPTGAENCLAGLTFVFTGLLDSISREEGQTLVKKYGGKVTGAPSAKTSYVVLGSQAGAKKIETIAKHGIATINEEGLFALIRRLPANGGDGNAAAEYEKKKAAKEEEIIQEAKRAEKVEKEQEKKKKAQQAQNQTSGEPVRAGGSRANEKPTTGPDTRLWTVKYAPTQLSNICGNKTTVERLQRWLQAFPKNLRTGFKLGGADGSGTFRAVIIHGPPGIGKTTAAHLVAKLEGYDIVETNASDTRSKKLVENSLKGVLSTTSLMGYFPGETNEVTASKKKLVLIMDEVDGMSAGDRGGVGALAAVCRKTQVPMILICNDRKLQKMKPFDYVTFDLQFRRPTVDQIRGRIMTICYREGMKIPGNAIDALIEGSQADIRQIVNMLATVKQDAEASEKQLNYDSTKAMAKAWEKNAIVSFWNIVNTILSGGLFAQSSKSTLNQKAELYFYDPDFSSLMLQENYLGTSPAAANQYQGSEKRLKNIELVDRAANSISEGDLCERMIRGGEGHWSLMPFHAQISFVRPASFVAGSMAGHATRFTSWLGQNSAYGRLSKCVREIQSHMRLRTTGNHHEIRQQYLPLLWTELIKRLDVKGKDSVPDIIKVMDEYFLTREDWEAIMDLGVDYMAKEKIKIDSASKATFTRIYNSSSHPLPFMKASTVTEPRKKTAGEKPDLLEAFEESDEGEAASDGEANKEAEAEDVDLSKDKYVQKPKKKKAAAAKGKKKAGGAIDDEVDAESDAGVGSSTKKGRGKGQAKAGRK